MFRDHRFFHTILAMLAGAFLVLAVQGINERWNRKAEAATIDQIARSTLVRLIEAIPNVRGEKIRGVAGLGDGHTFIVYTDKDLRFYQFGYGVPSSKPRR